MTTDTSNSLFQKAVAFVNQTGRHLFITGKAGTGKTTFLRYIREHCPKKMAVVAPTGVAAINAGGMTIHSFFQLPQGLFIPSESNEWVMREEREIHNRYTLLKNLKLNSNKRTVLKELELLIIDEVSMVRADLLDAMDTVLRHVRNAHHLPFGGVQMVYIGDLFQLPPVARREDWSILEQYYNSPFFFDALAAKERPPLYIELKKIYRQKDDVFINILNGVRNNQCSTAQLELLHNRYQPAFEPDKKDNFITLTSHNAKADTINQQQLDKLPGRVYSYNAEVNQEFPERSFPAEKELRLKVGAQVMFIKNDKGETRRYFNGKLATITRLEGDKIAVTFPNETEEMELELEKWENIRYKFNSQDDKMEKEELGSFKQYPIRLAWAITIHKSQGLTFDRAVVDAGESFAAGQVYVALSRLTSLEGLVLKSRILPSCISTDARVLRYTQAEVQEAELASTLEVEQKLYLTQSLLKYFSFTKMGEAFERNLEAYESRQIPDKVKCVEWAYAITAVAKDVVEVTGKFCRQLQQLFPLCETSGYQHILDRTQKASSYLEELLKSKLTASLQQHMEEMKGKTKTKLYLKGLEQLQTIVAQKTQQLQQAVKLAQALHNSAGVEELFTIVEEKISIAAAPDMPKEQPVKSHVQTLELYRQGLTIPEIAQKRSMAVSTIEGHLLPYVATGDIDVLQFATAEQVSHLLSLMKEHNKTRLAEVKTIAGIDFSFTVVRAVIQYREWLLKKAEETAHNKNDL